MITVVNKKVYRGEGIYIGRSMPGIEGGILANRFRIGLNGSREQCIDAYRFWLRRMYKAGRWHQAHGIESYQRLVYEELMKLVEMYRRGEDIILICWCAPLTCHGDVIKDAIEKLAVRS
jgi:hypothetical protein